MKMMPLAKHIDDKTFINAGNTSPDNINDVLLCLQKDGLDKSDIHFEDWVNSSGEVRYAVYINSQRWSLHHSHIISDHRGWEKTKDCQQ